MVKKNVPAEIEEVFGDSIKEVDGETVERGVAVTPPENYGIIGKTDFSMVRESFGGAVDKDVLIVPRAKVMQFTSPELAQDGALRPGMIIESIGNRPLSERFVPVKCEHSYMMFNPAADQPGHVEGVEESQLLWKTTDPTPEQRALCKFGTDGSKPVGIESIDFLCLFEGEALPCWLSFQKTNLTAGKKLYTQLWASSLRGVPMYGNKFSIKTRLVNTNPQRKYYEIMTQYVGTCSEEEYNIAKQFQKLNTGEPTQD